MRESTASFSFMIVFGFFIMALSIFMFQNCNDRNLGFDEIVGDREVVRNLSLQWHNSSNSVLDPIVRHCRAKILLLGDSVDRYVVLEYCESQNITPSNWSHGLFKYKQIKSERKNSGKSGIQDKALLGAAYCSTSKGIIGHLHLFGSNASGPYHGNLKNHKEDRFIDTTPRICTGIKLFGREFGIPSMIVFQIVFWDACTMSRWPAELQAAIYRRNIVSRLHDIVACKEPATALYLRTALMPEWKRRSVALYNSILRNISKEMRVPLIDFDSAVRGPGGRTDPGLFRDATHPRRDLTAKLGADLLAVGGRICAAAPGPAGGRPSRRDGPGGGEGPGGAGSAAGGGGGGG